jgi:stage II sporulation protein D
MRRFSLLAVLLGVLAFSSSALASTLFVVDGRGWGHGVGMSQWGAQGRALRGVNHGAILGFYYPGTTIGQTTVRRMRVLLTSGRSSVAVSSDGPFKIGNKTLQPHTVYNLVPSADGQVRIAGLGKFGNPATVTPTTAFLRLGGSPYRGSFKVWVRSGKLAVVNVVGLQAYLYGVVPRESPSWFEMEALKAQADAARSYAIRAQRASWFDLYADTRDQVYGGACAGCETARTTAAVQETVGEIVMYGGQVAQTFFSSSNGGYKAASVDVWGGSVPYLQAGPDPDDLTPGNPNRYWKHILTPRQMATRLGIGRPRDVSVARDGSDRAKTVTFVTGSGTPSLGGSTVMANLGLKGRRYWIGIQSFTASRSRSSCKQRVNFSIFSHGLAGIALQRRPVTGSTWTNLPLTVVDSSHRTARHRPCVSTDYRLRSNKATNPIWHLKVAPAIAFDELQRQGALTGKVNPLLPGNLVTIQRRTSSGWQPVATTTIRDNGSFRAAFAVTDGVYRAKVVPPSSTGLVTGFSPRLTVDVTG